VLVLRPFRVQFVESFVASKVFVMLRCRFLALTVEFTKFVTFVIFATSSSFELELKLKLKGMRRNSRVELRLS